MIYQSGDQTDAYNLMRNSLFISERNSNRKTVGVFQRMQKEDGGCIGKAKN